MKKKMPKKISFYFYLSLISSIIGFIFPTHVSSALSPVGYVADIVHWVYGFYILSPFNPVEESKFYFNPQIQGLFLIVCAIFLVVVSFVELRYAKCGNRYDKNPIYAIAILQLIVSQIYLYGWLAVRQLSSWGFIFSALFALIGNKELKIFYIDEGKVNAKNEIFLGVVLIMVSLISIVYHISIFLSCVAPYSTDKFSLFIANMFPALIWLLIMLIYGIYSLIRAIRVIDFNYLRNLFAIKSY